MWPLSPLYPWNGFSRVSRNVRLTPIYHKCTRVAKPRLFAIAVWDISVENRTKQSGVDGTACFHSRRRVASGAQCIAGFGAIHVCWLPSKRAKSAANTVEATFATEHHGNEGVVASLTAKIRARRERMPRLWHSSNRPCCACSQERRCETSVRSAAGQPRCVPIWRASCQRNMSFLKAEELKLCP